MKRERISSGSDVPSGGMRAARNGREGGASGTRTETAEEVAPIPASLRLPTQAASPGAPGQWGMLIFLLVDGALYASLVFAYFYLWLDAPAWPPPCGPPGGG